MKTAKRIPTTIESTLVVFHGYDGKDYTAFVQAVRRGVARLAYQVPGHTATVIAYISDSTRIETVR